MNNASNAARLAVPVQRCTAPCRWPAPFSISTLTLPTLATVHATAGSPHAFP